MGELIVDDSRAADGFLEASMHIGAERHRLYFERLDGPLAAGCADPFVLATLSVFMHRGEPMHVTGPVTRRLLIGLEEWQRAWSRWRPAALAEVEVTADEVLVGYPTSSKAVTTFTGGVDSTYTVHRHVSGAAGNAMTDLNAGLFVHGFDIPLDDRLGFERACRRSATFLDEMGVGLIPMRTNLRALGYDWEDEHGLAVAAVLTALAPDYGVGLIASTYPYLTSVVRWGSNPITDPLMSSGMMDIRYDGADATRAEKVKALLANSAAIAQLRFCWESEIHDVNCGVCSKCIHTACAFMASGVTNAACFTRWPTVDEIRSVRFSTPGIRESLGWVLEVAAEEGRAEEAWFTALSEALAGPG